MVEAKPASRREEFRRHATVALVLFGVGWVVAWLEKETLLSWIVEPLVRNAPHMPEPPLLGYSLFSIYVHIATVGALLLSLPFLALASWAFACPRSYGSAKRSVPIFIAASYVTEAVAVLVVQFLLLPVLLRGRLAPLESAHLDDYVGLLFRASVGMSVVFELAVIAVFAVYHRGAANSTTLDEPTSSARAKNAPR